MKNRFHLLSNVFGILTATLFVGISNLFAQNVNVNFTNFTDISALTLSGSTAGYGNPIDVGGDDVLRLTNSSGSQAGGAFLTQSISLQNEASFSTYFTFRMSSPGNGGADGLAFVVQRNSNQYGGAGGGIGYYGIDNSLAIEFDTWNNGAMDGHNGNHVGIGINGDLNSVARANIGTEMANGAVWHAWVDYDGATNALEVRLAENDTRPANPTVSYSVDIAAVLGQADAFVGFTAATGGAFENHDIVSWFFTNDFAPIEEAPNQVTWQDNDHLYQAFAQHQGGLTWPEANDLANAMSYTDVNGNYWYAHLATVASQAENDFITNTFPAAMQWIYWLGGYQVDHGNEPAGGWAWVTGEAWDYTNWQPGEPNDYAGNQEEVLMFYGGMPRWNDITIDYQGFGMVVEWEIVPQNPPGIAWNNNGHYYYPVATAGLTWPQANDAANAMSFTDASGNYWVAHLLTVTSSAENQFIVDNFVSQMQQLYFLGGHQVNFDNEPAGGWAWVTGEPWSYTNWGANEPNNQYGTEQIIHFWNLNGGWNDHQIYWTSNGYMVEFEMQAQTSPEISLSTADLNFGDVLINTSSNLTFQINNEGDADLNVSDVSVSGAGFTTDFGGAFSLAPGGQQTVTVTFSPTAVGNYSGTVTVTSDDGDESTLTVSLAGTGVAPDIAVAPTALNYGQVIYSNSSELTFGVSNIGSADLHYNIGTISGAGFTLAEATGSYTLTPGMSATFHVTFTAIGLGSFSGSLDITSDDQSNGNATVSFSGEGVAPDIAVSPISIDFGSVLVGSSGSGSFTVSNNGTSDLHYVVPAATGDGFALVEEAGTYTLGIGASAEFNVTFAPGAFGAVNGGIAITSDDPFDGNVTVALAGTGIGPIITIAPTTLAFGNVEFWRTATLDFTVSNEGTAPGTLSGLSGAAAPFSVPFSAVTLNPGASTTFTVTYTAATLGSFTGTLALSSDDYFHPSQEISLSGTTIWVAPAVLASRLCDQVHTYGPDDCRNGCQGDDDDHNGDDDDDEDDHNGDHHGEDDDDDDDNGHNNNDYVLNCGQVRSLCELLEQAARNLEHHEGDHAIRSFEHFIERINRLVGQQELTVAAGAALVGEANFIISLIEAYDPEMIFDRIASQIRTIERNLGRNRNRLNTLKARINSAESAWEHNNNASTLTYLGQFNTEATRLASVNTITGVDAALFIEESNQIADMIQNHAIADDQGQELSTSEVLPTEVSLSNGYPNPFNSTTNIRFTMPEAGNVEMSLFDLTGREVTRLVTGAVEAGFHSVAIDGSQLRAGMYLVRLNAMGQTQIVKVTYIK